jgi:hypothetical protein
MRDLFASAPPSAPWRVVCDNLNTHMSEGVTRLVAELCGIEDDLGEPLAKLGWQREFLPRFWLIGRDARIRRLVSWVCEST